MEVSVLDDSCDDWLDESGQMLEDQEGSEEGCVESRNEPEQSHPMPLCPHAEEGLLSEKQVYATRSGKPVCPALRKSTRQRN